MFGAPIPRQGLTWPVLPAQLTGAFSGMRPDFSTTRVKLAVATL